ncbi:hypothetical protein [Candidatus Sororendozoicomonas aggregata]
MQQTIVIAGQDNRYRGGYCQCFAAFICFFRQDAHGFRRSQKSMYKASV